jgi:hypothetical protein
MKKGQAVMHTRIWSLNIYLTEDEHHTLAQAVLRTDVGTELRHAGYARRAAADRNVPEIGDELATCRALTGLAQDLLDASVGDIEENVGEPVNVSV